MLTENQKKKKNDRNRLNEKSQNLKNPLNKPVFLTLISHPPNLTFDKFGQVLSQIMNKTS